MSKREPHDLPLPTSINELVPASQGWSLVKEVDRTLLRLKRFDRREQEANRRRCEAAGVFLFLCLVTLGARVWYFQVVQGEDLRARSEKNRIRVVRLQPPRGKILDHSGRLLVGSQPSFNVCLRREEAGADSDVEEILRQLAPLLNESVGALRERLVLGHKQPLYTPIVLKRGIDREALALVEARLFRFPGVSIEVEPTRKYPYGNLAPHVIGYLSEVSGEDLASNRFPEARGGDLVGRSGVEARFHNVLAGKMGARRLEVDRNGRLVRILDEQSPVPGEDIYLTVDVDVQRAAEEAMADKVGAVVALDPRDGRILALVSSPGYDLASFAQGLTVQEWDVLNDPVRRPLHNKALQGRYAPGSVFKVITAAAALESGVIHPETLLQCEAYFRLGRRVFRCWDWRGHGQVDLYKGLVQSCDIYFYQLGLRLGVDRIARYARGFGLGAKTGIDLPNESSGLIATSDWKMERFQEPWQDGETLNVAIGQGFTLVTPIQVASFMAAVANGGTLYRPFYIEQIKGSDGRVLETSQGEAQGWLPISASHLGIIQRALVGVTQDKRGTGRASRVEGLLIAGKTGTAQVVKQAKRREDEKMAWKFRDHAWFAAYAPAENPALTVVVLIEHGGHGGSAAAPVAQKIFEAWYRLQGPLPTVVPIRTAGVDIQAG